MAEMWKVIVKNYNAIDYLIEDLGISVLASGLVNFHEQFNYDEIAGSDDLRYAVDASELVVNDGNEDLSAVSGTEYLTLENLHHLAANYYSKTELQTPGQSEINWNNITGTPDLIPNTLDGAYDEGGSGLGRAIDVDAGAVQFNATTSGYAPIELTEQVTLPNIGLAGGQLSVKGGILYTYDSTRSKWLSVQRMFLTFGKKGKTKKQFLAFAGGELYSNNSGYRLARNATLVSIAGQLDSSGSCDIAVRKNDSPIDIATLGIVSTVGNSDTGLNVDLDTDDYIQSYLESTAGVEDPMVVIEIAWRE